MYLPVMYTIKLYQVRHHQHHSHTTDCLFSNMSRISATDIVIANASAAFIGVLF